MAGNLAVVLRVLTQMFGTTVATEFGPTKLRLVREAMVWGDATATPPRRPWTRQSINKQIRRIAAVFRWAASQEMVPAAVCQALKTLEPLQRGQTTAKESEPIKPVSPEVVNAVRPFLSRQINALIDLQLLTGARGGELFSLRKGDIERSRRVWAFAPAEHKTASQGKIRRIYFGPQAQRVLRPFMLRPDTDYLFSPTEAEAERRHEMHVARKILLSCGNRPGRNVKESPNRQPGDHYTKDSYCRAIHRACVRAFPIPAELAHRRVAGRKGGKSRRWETDAELRKRLGEEKWVRRRNWIRQHHWHPHQLRHTAATVIRREFGLEAAQVALGHSSALVTDAVYAERDLAKVEEVMLKIG
ncbi:MAG: site-specific integrase [Planctomycetota bacterium]|nr:site-specific integrase [Planctomycetota bacterium]